MHECVLHFDDDVDIGAGGDAWWWDPKSATFPLVAMTLIRFDLYCDR